MNQEIRNGKNIALLNTEDGLLNAAKILADGGMLLTGYGAVYGTSFNPNARMKAAILRGERPHEDGKFDTVSVVAPFSLIAKDWIDTAKINPEFVKPGLVDKLSIFTNIAFIRFPATDVAKSLLKSNYVNDMGELQAFPTADDDRLVRVFEKESGYPFYAVRSANIHGQPEATNFEQLGKFRRRLINRTKRLSRHEHEKKSKVLVALPNSAYVQNEAGRMRIGSQPIIQLSGSNGSPEIAILRKGNTGEETLRRMIQGVFGDGINVVYRPEKTESITRTFYDAPDEIQDPWLIRENLLRASGIL